MKKFYSIIMINVLLLFMLSYSTYAVSTLIYKKGSAQSKYGSGVWVNISRGGKLKDNEWIRTGSNSTVIVGLTNGSKIKIGSRTVVKIKSLKNKKIVYLSKGSLLGKFKKLEKTSYQVNTPVASAGVRGTTFLTNVTGDTNEVDTTFSVKEGSIEVQNLSGGNPVIVEEGNSTTVSQNEPPSNPKPIKDTNINWSVDNYNPIVPYQADEINTIKSQSNNQTKENNNELLKFFWFEL